ncbi:MAG: hypothetical protein N2653_13450 [Burkholderiales bacterium]|nr:hypothetical protein [Burkholderiales bacterium]
MHVAVQGALIGLAVAIVWIAADYALVRQVAARRALAKKRNVELDATERRRVMATARFALGFLPVAGAFVGWAFFG